MILSQQSCVPNLQQIKDIFQEPENWNEEKEEELDNPVLEKVDFSISSFLPDAK